MQTTEMAKSMTYILMDSIKYESNSVISRTILQRATGNVSIMAFDKGKSIAGKISPFDTFIQIIEGRAEVIIDHTSNLLQMGEAIIIPAHTANVLKANERFKMIATIF